jgi:hypothetical protein
VELSTRGGFRVLGIMYAKMRVKPMVLGKNIAVVYLLMNKFT